MAIYGRISTDESIAFGTTQFEVLDRVTPVVRQTREAVDGSRANRTSADARGRELPLFP